MTGPIVCIGGSFVDELFHTREEILYGSTNAATVKKAAGGVGRNIAHQLALLEVPVQLISVFGNDQDGDWLKKICSDAGIKFDASITIDDSTGKYLGIIDKDGALYTAFLTNQINRWLSPQHLELRKELLQTASWLMADTNIPIETINWLLQFSRHSGIPLIIEPVSVPPAKKLMAADLSGLYAITPNEDELPALCSEKSYTTAQQIDELLSREVQMIWLHHGKDGSVLYSREQAIKLPAAPVDVIDCTGAGDASVAGFLLGKYLGKDHLDCLKLAHTLSSEVLKIDGAVPEKLSQQELLTLVSKYYSDK